MKRLLTWLADLLFVVVVCYLGAWALVLGTIHAMRVFGE